MKKFFIALITLLALAAAGTAAYIYFSTKNAVDKMISSARPFVDIQYQRFTNPMDGSISLHDVTMNTGNDSVKIGSIELRLDSALDYVNFDKKMKSGEIPPKFQVRINHMITDLPETTQASMEQMPMQQIANYIAALGCGDVKEMNTSHMNELGFTELDTSTNLDFTYNKTSSQATFQANMSMHGMTDIELKTSISDVNNYFDFANPENKVSAIETTIQDLGYNNKIIEFCSEKAQLEPQQYVDNHIKQLRKYLNKSGVSLSDELYDTYKSYFADATPIKFVLSPPSNSLSLKYIDLYDVKDWPSILGLSIYNDGKQLEDITFEWKKGKALPKLLNARSLPKVQDKQTKNAKKKKAQRLIPRKFVEIPADQLSRYISSTVKIESKLGKSYTGVVKQVSSSQIVVEIKLQGGKAAMPINTFQIKKAYLLQ